MMKRNDKLKIGLSLAVAAFFIWQAFATGCSGGGGGYTNRSNDNYQETETYRNNNYQEVEQTEAEPQEEQVHEYADVSFTNETNEEAATTADEEEVVMTNSTEEEY